MAKVWTENCRLAASDGHLIIYDILKGFKVDLHKEKQLFALSFSSFMVHEVLQHFSEGSNHTIHI